jgi:hypothetical protein
VQWRNQDEGGALLRDQLRQAAQAWQDRGRPDDLLWTGSSFLEFQAWRARYTGGLSTTEEAFAQAAAKLAGRGQAATIAVAALITAVSMVALVTSSSGAGVKADPARALRASRSRARTDGREQHRSSAYATAASSCPTGQTAPGARSLWRGPTYFDIQAELLRRHSV